MTDSNEATNSSTGALANDKTLRPFLAPTFDPADYLNATLPAWTPSTSNRSSATASSSVNISANSLSELNNQTQAILSQLSAQLTRLSTQLTKLTDEILRSGGRLAYEVEILRGETGALSDILVNGLADELNRFIPGGLRPQLRTRRRSSAVKAGPIDDSEEDGDKTQEKEALKSQPADQMGAAEAITRLRTLALVRDRLESVVKVFGAAVDWPVPPSDVNMRSTFISVAGPEAEDTEEREKAGKAWADKTRNEVTNIVAAQGYEAALARVEEFQELATVWKGTSEEKARLKFVNSLTKMIEEKKGARAGAQAKQSSRSYGLG